MLILIDICRIFNTKRLYLLGFLKWRRLLRNRVSAQQARERKKAYLSDLEGRVKDLEKKNSELEERLSTLQNENQMLRHVMLLYLTIFFYLLIIIKHPSSIIALYSKNYFVGKSMYLVF